MALSEFQSLSSTSTIQNNLKLSELQKVREKDSQTDFGTQKAGFLSRLSTEKESISGYLSDGRCNGIMGVPITFLDKYNPEQFEILGLERYTVPKECLVSGRLAIDRKPKYARILIKRKK